LCPICVVSAALFGSQLKNQSIYTPFDEALKLKFGRSPVAEFSHKPKRLADLKFLQSSDRLLLASSRFKLEHSWQSGGDRPILENLAVLQ
jgi:hypothetical protein